jgi:peptidoglycan biosynthesis protein MviN/MurJ (putative lipid II flippase)
MLIVNFFIQGLCKLLGFKKRYDILQILGTTYLGDIYRICYSWPNIFKRILLDGTLDFVIIPYLLEGNALGEKEFNKRNNQLFNTITALLIGLMVIFFFLTPLLTSSINYPEINKYYLLYFGLIFPMGINIIFNEIFIAKSYFLFNNIGQIINNLIFIGSIFFFKKYMLMGIWASLFLGFMVNNLYSFIFILYKGYLGFSWDFLPLYVLKDMGKSGLFQVANRLNHLVINVLGSRLLVPGILIASDIVDNIIHSIVSILASTIILILTPKLYDYFTLNNDKYKKLCQEIIMALFMATFLISGYLFLNASTILSFLIKYKPNINHELLSTILKWSSGQVFILSCIKFFQRILTLQKQLNRTIFIALGSSFISTIIELIYFNKYHVYALIFSHYLFLLIELFSMIYFLNKNARWQQLWKGFSWNYFLKKILMIMVCLAISKWGNYFVKGNYFHIKFLLINGCWGLMVLLLFWRQWKIFLKKI